MNKTTIVHYIDGTTQEIRPPLNLSQLKEAIKEVSGNFVTITGVDYIIMLDKVTYFENREVSRV